MAAPDLDLETVLGLTPATGAEDQKRNSRWLSTSTTDSDLELNNFWHDSTTLDDFYTTQDTVNTLDSFTFNDDSLFFGPFDSCSTGISPARNQHGTSHVTKSSESGTHMNEPNVLDRALLDFQHLPALAQDDTNLLPWDFQSPDELSATPTSLKDRLNKALVRGDNGSPFLPDDALVSILSHQVVISELQKELPTMTPRDLQQLANQIMTNPNGETTHSTARLRIFAILVLLDKAISIVDFVREGLSDEALPFVKTHVVHTPPGSPKLGLRKKGSQDQHIPTFDGWSEGQIDTFEKLQWRIISPNFRNISKQRDCDFLDLEDQTVLPYIESWQNKKHDHYKGGNSEVWKVRIHDAHHNFQNLSAGIPNNPYFAIKKLKSKDDEAFRREVRNLQRLHNAEHPNLLTLLATYKYHGYYHLVFPWADGDLRRLWQSTPNPQAGKEEMRWLASQCSSIASALKSVHAGAESWMNGNTAAGGDGPNGQQRMAMNKYGIHGDIKPENIFIFSKGQQQKSFKALAMGPPNRTDDTTTASTSSSDRGSRSPSPSSIADEFIIGDFGSGAFYDPSLGPDPLRQITVTYRPPEYDTKLKPVSRAWDVWGLGCTYLEFVTWFLLGPSGLTEFAKRRTTRTAAGKLSDEYFETFIDGCQPGGIGATLKESVLAWIGELHRHQNSSQFIREFLDFITHRMFVVENANLVRASGEEVADHLNELTRKCFDDDAYCLPYSKVLLPWEIQGLAMGSSISALPSTTPVDFGFDFANATTEDVSSTAAWHLPSLDVGALGQWNTAPIMPTGGSTFASMNSADLLGAWNYTTPVMWDNSRSSNAYMSQSNDFEKKRKRKIEEVTDDEPERRVSPKTSTTSPTSNVSPEATSSSCATQSPAVEINDRKVDKRFACPYYKNNPGKFRHKRTCCGPGWPTVHRVKEHLYRCHTIGKHTCSRCLKRCKNAAELLSHQRAAVPCETRTDAFPEGTMLPSQEEILRVKKRVPPNTTEEDRWNEMYLVLFPDADAGALPTPFYEDESSSSPPFAERSSKGDAATPTATTHNNSTASIGGPGEWFCTPAEYEQYLNRSLPSRVQRELEKQVQEELDFVGGDGARARAVVGLVQRMQTRLFQQLKQERRRDDTAVGEEGGGG